ncbi:MAG: hypothetical protein ABI596_17510 [Pyrinomonadaceae bacterium]
MKRIMMFGALALLFVVMGCNKSQSTLTAATPPAPNNDAESVNSVAGSFTVTGYFAKDKPPETVTLTQAYARRVKNQDDPTTQDVLILLTEKALSRKVLAEAEDDKGSLTHFQAKLENRGARGIQLRFTAKKKLAPGEEKQEAESEGENDFDSIVHFNGSAIQTNVLLFKPAVFSADSVQGSITARGDWEGKFNINFKVSLRPQGWTGGTFYVQPPTNLEPGRARGQVVIDGKATNLNYVYARQQGHDMFDEKENRVKLFFTEKPVTDEALGEDIEHLLRMKEAGNNYTIRYQLSAKDQSDFPELWAVGQLSSTTNMVTLAARRDMEDTITNTDIDLSKFDDRTIDGKIYTTGPNRKFDHTYELDVSFNVQISKPDPTDAPVTAGSGQPLPADGGAPGKAYLAFIKAVEASRNLKELTQVLENSLSARPLAESRKSLATVPAAEEQATLGMLKMVLIVKDARIAGGFGGGDKATLSITGTDGGQKANARVNLHLENGQWKVGAASTRVGSGL